MSDPEGRTAPELQEAGRAIVVPGTPENSRRALRALQAGVPTTLNYDTGEWTIEPRSPEEWAQWNAWSAEATNYSDDDHEYVVADRDTWRAEALAQDGRAAIAEVERDRLRAKGEALRKLLAAVRAQNRRYQLLVEAARQVLHTKRPETESDHHHALVELDAVLHELDAMEKTQ